MSWKVEYNSLQVKCILRFLVTLKSNYIPRSNLFHTIKEDITPLDKLNISGSVPTVVFSSQGTPK